jgi:hypothetical protein
VVPKCNLLKTNKSPRNSFPPNPHISDVSSREKYPHCLLETPAVLQLTTAIAHSTVVHWRVLEKRACAVGLRASYRRDGPHPRPRLLGVQESAKPPEACVARHEAAAAEMAFRAAGGSRRPVRRGRTNLGAEGGSSRGGPKGRGNRLCGHAGSAMRHTYRHAALILSRTRPSVHHRLAFYRSFSSVVLLTDHVCVDR